MRRGRPSHANQKWTSETRQAVIVAVRAGNYLNTAAAYAKVSYVTLNRWLRRGEAAEYRRQEGEELSPAEAEFADFYLDYREAEAQMEMVIVKNWRDVARTDWKAGSAFLSRRLPEKWGPKVELNVGTKDDEILELLDSMGIAGADDERPSLDDGIIDAEIVEDSDSVEIEQAV